MGTGNVPNVGTCVGLSGSVVVWIVVLRDITEGFLFSLSLVPSTLRPPILPLRIPTPSSSRPPFSCMTPFVQASALIEERSSGWCSSSSSEVSWPSREGVPPDISVETVELYVFIVFWAAAFREEMMAGPGNMWAFVISDHFAIWRGPEVYCFCTVPVISCQHFALHFVI